MFGLKPDELAAYATLASVIFPPRLTPSVVHDLAPIVYHAKVKGLVHTALESFDLTTVWLDG